MHFEISKMEGLKMEKTENFGELLKSLRLKAELTLREFCRKAGEDPANLSRIERSLRPAPCDDVVERYAKALGITPDSERGREFFDFAAISRKELPKDITSNEEIAAKLPAMLRTLRGNKPTEEDLENALDITRKAFRP
jgi:transcriptional regulator with XRE-family HTH domain